MVKENISVKFLIHLVGERPALWDKTSEDYKDRALKEISWREICSFINENYEQMQPKPKEEFTRMIMRKWTHIRDSWVKSMKYGYDEVTKIPQKPYIYHNYLHFMQKILKCRPPRYNLNMSKVSNRNFEEFYRDKNETQTSGGVSNGIKQSDEENENEEAGGDGDHETGDLSTENFKQEIGEEHREEQEEDTDFEWPYESTNTTTQNNDNKLDEIVIKKRISIFKNSHNEDEYEKSKNPQIVRPVKKLKRPLPAANIRQSRENRHWNFFKGILPSVNGLDEDNVLKFQSGVIALLQKLRESQKRQPNAKSNRVSSHSLCRGRGRKRKTSCEDDEEFSVHNVDENRGYTTRRSRRKNFDPIAAEDLHSENSYSTDN